MFVTSCSLKGPLCGPAAAHCKPLTSSLIRLLARRRRGPKGGSPPVTDKRRENLVARLDKFIFIFIIYACGGNVQVCRRHKNDKFEVKRTSFISGLLLVLPVNLFFLTSRRLDERRTRAFKRKRVLTQDDLGSLSAAELLRPRVKHLEKHWQRLLMLTHSRLRCLAGLQLCQKGRR